MNLIFRLILVALVARFGSRMTLGAASHVRLCVLPNDLDWNLHMNNGRYLTLFDLGRIDILIRMGLVRLVLRSGWQPLIGGSIIRYRFGLKPFERFEIVTRVLCWDEKWFYFEQRMDSRRGTAAIALAKGLFRDRDGTVAPSQILNALGTDAPSPEFPERVLRWTSSEAMLQAKDSILVD